MTPQEVKTWLRDTGRINSTMGYDSHAVKFKAGLALIVELERQIAERDEQIDQMATELAKCRCEP